MKEQIGEIIQSKNLRDISMDILSKGHNVAMVFDKLPETYMGYKVINGDETDLRFLDDKNVIVGLKYKKMTGFGGAKKNIEALENGFVIVTQDKVIKKVRLVA